MPRGVRARATSPRSSNGRMMVAVAVATTVSMLPVFLVGGLVPFIRGDIDVDASRLGVLVALFFAASSLAATPGGRLAEHLGARKALLTGNTVTAVTLFLMGILASAWWHLAAALVLAGASNGLTQPGTNLALMGSIREGRQGIAFGIKQSAVPGATLLTGLAIPAVALTIGWRWAFAGAMLAIPVVAGLLPADPRNEVGGHERSGLSQNVRPLVHLAFAAGLAVAAASTLGTFLVDSIISSGGSAKTAAALLTVGSIAAITVRLLVGWGTDRATPSIRSVALLVAVGGFGFLTLGAASSWPLWLLGSLISFGAGWGWAGLFFHTVSTMYSEAPAAATGITQSGYSAGAVLGPLMFGTVADGASFTTGWTVTAAFAFTGAWLLFRIRVKHDVPSQATP